jgi:3-deoxy-D-manno-octulosonate 8-phosphate phosphatase (KDO 8-P phosphatase)
MNFLDKLNNIQNFVFDIDGVFTDGSVLVQDDGSLLRIMNTKDGLALKHAAAQGYNIYVISGGKSLGVFYRLESLGVKRENIFFDCHDKLALLKQLVEELELDLSKTAYMGDDIPDYGPMCYVHLPCCPADAIPEIRSVAQYVSPLDGGKGCVRDLLEKVMKVQGKWFNTDDLKG